MSFTCDNCGNNSVSMYGKWCNECQKREAYAQEEADDRWYSSSRLCQNCMWAEGSDQSDKCTEYNMPLYMVKRKFKCIGYIEARY